MRNWSFSDLRGEQMSLYEKKLDLDLSTVPTIPLWRPDSVHILNDKDAIYRFNRYWRILTNEALSKFLILKKIETEQYSTNDEDSLWSLHDKYMSVFEEIISDKEDSEIIAWWKSRDKPYWNLLKLKRDLAYQIIRNCRYCEFKCKVDRTKNQIGVCRVGLHSKIASMFVHVGEEPELVPSYTIFFSGCNFRCVYCQNWDISQQIVGLHLDPKDVALRIETHWRHGEIRNVNWVGGSPTPNIHFILDVLMFLDENVPQIWNSNLYNSIEALKLLHGVIDLWLPDFKYGNNKCGLRLSKVPRYFDVITRNLSFINKNYDETLIRHLVLPNHIECCSIPILRWIHRNLNLEVVRVNIMSQYRPEYKAMEYQEISRPITREEYSRVIEYAKELMLPLTM